MAKTIACLIARTASTRLPLKVLREVTPGVSMLDFIIQRLKLVSNIDSIYLCTSSEITDDIMEDVAARNKINIYRGSPNQVIERLLSVAEKENATDIIRITGDNVFNAYEYMNDLVAMHTKNNLDYSKITGLPFGSTPEVMSVSALKDCNSKTDPTLSEYLTVFMFLPELYKCGMLKINDINDYSNRTLTVDLSEDLVRTKLVLQNYTSEKLKITTKEIMQLIDEHQIPYSMVNVNAELKLPFNITVKMADFIRELNLKATQSFQQTI